MKTIWKIIKNEARSKKTTKNVDLLNNNELKNFFAIINYEAIQQDTKDTTVINLLRPSKKV